MPRIRTVLLAAALLASLLAAAPGGPAAAACTAERSGATVTLSWLDNGGKHIIRRNDNWLATPGFGADSHVDSNAPAGASYELRTWNGGVRMDVDCSEGPAATTTTTTVPVPEDGCTATVNGSTVELRWLDEGGRHVIRRDGRWMATIEGAGRWTDTSAPNGATYDLRIWLRGKRTDVTCVDVAGPGPTTTTSAPPPDGGSVERVLHVSIDALRSDHVTSALAPNLTELIVTGASTLNARTDRDLTKTLPNHTSQFTGRTVRGADGHQVDFNEDNLQTIHDVAGTHVESIFDVVDAEDGHTAVFVGKSKFDFLHRSWSDVIDTYRRSDPNNLVDDALTALRTGEGPVFVSYHIRLPDSAGHASGWAGGAYDHAVRDADTILGRLLDGIRADTTLNATTAVILTSDHGGPNSGLLHDDATNVTNYTVPFVAWGPGVRAGANLYALNSATRTDPGTSRPANVGPQPIRGHDMANLALDLLGLPAVPGSTVNAAQDLRVG